MNYNGKEIPVASEEKYAITNEPRRMLVATELEDARCESHEAMVIGYVNGVWLALNKDGHGVCEYDYAAEIPEEPKAAKYEQRIKELEAEVIGYKASLERANFKMCEKDARIKELEASLQKERDFGLHIARCADHEIAKLTSENARAQTK